MELYLSLDKKSQLFKRKTEVFTIRYPHGEDENLLTQISREICSLPITYSPSV